GSATRRLKHLAGDLVDRRIAVRAKRGVRRAGAGRQFVARGVDIVETVEAHDPLSPAVRTGTDEVVIGGVNQRRWASGRFVGGLIGRAGSRVKDGQPRTIGAGNTGAASRVHALVDGGPAVRCCGGAIACERVEV